VQKPHPPVIVGGAWPHGARRAVRYGDGWIPLASRPDYEDVTAFLPEFRKLAEAANRDPATLPVSIFSAPEDIATLRRYRDAGVVRAVVGLPSESADSVLPILDRWTKLIQQLGE
jgi:alkanesulfonate monooxygenase SsuD/methylene tetrahydromethanopterin reductase-like flavin-dependent oxidoreductase (luciferase family)